MDAALATLFDKAVGDRFGFDMLNQDTQDMLRAQQDALIQQLENDARDAIDGIVTAGALMGLSAEDIVADIRELIGLTDTQAQAVLNYRSMLESLDPDALARQLRNDDYDALLREAMDGETPLAVDIVDKMVADYTDNYLDYRAETIARTESNRAANAGLQDAYQQAVDRGALPADAVRQFWQVALDEKTCAVCLSIPDLNPDGVPLGDPFESDDGPMDAPPDPHPNCRCSLEFVTDLDKVPDDQEEQAA